MPQPFDTAKHDRFLRLVAEHQAALHNFTRSMLPNRGEASEVLQDVMVVLWQKFDAAEDFKKWAFGVARLETLKFLQSRARDRHVFDDELANRLADDMVSLEQRHLSQREAPANVDGSKTNSCGLLTENLSGVQKLGFY
ncbi:MAG TPA: hypothetical protein EYQ50_12975 [Verrucomicrobiales bacterium]|nr:hypothetical protein [Verrucomicrobiales bacterium]HIL69617.1 hypothetical protein [Verrucomicrobiota bacterium]